MEEVNKELEKQDSIASEGGSRDDDKKKISKKRAITPEDKKRIKEQYEEQNRRKRAQGEDITEKELEEQREFIEKGIPIISGGSEDGNFSNFDPTRFESNSSLEELARKVQAAGLQSKVDSSLLENIRAELNRRVQLGLVSDNESRDFTAYLNEFVNKSNEEEIRRKDAPSGRTEENLSDTERDESQEMDQLNLGMEWELANSIGDSDTSLIIDQFRASARKLGEIFSDKESKKSAEKEILNILSSKSDLGAMRENLKSFLRKAAEQRKRNISEGKIEVSAREITSIQDLSKFIMARQESALYATGNKYELIDTRGNFKPENFLIWVREQIIQLHDDNRTAEMSPLSAVAIETDIRTMTIYSMTRFKGQYFRDQSTNEILRDLADNIVNMCYYFGFFRNMDLAYRQTMNRDDELPETIAKIHAGSDVTHDDNWASFLSMPDKYGHTVEEGSDLTETKTGDGMLVANDIYYNMSDIEELKAILGEESGFFSKEGFKKAMYILQDKLQWQNLDDFAELYDVKKDYFYITDSITGEKKAIFDSDGRIIEKNFFELMNIFNKASADFVPFVREMVRLGVAEKTGLDYGFLPTERVNAEKSRFEEIVSEIKEEAVKKRWNVDDKLARKKAEEKIKRDRKASRINLTFAEYSSYVQQRPLLVASRNDTNRRGYDAMSKMDINYVIRQSSEGTAGSIGNEEFYLNPIFKNIGVDFLTGLKTNSGRAPVEIFRDIREVRNNKELSLTEKQERKNKLLAELRFKEGAALDFTANHIKRAFQIFHALTGGEEMNLDKIVQYKPMTQGGIFFDTAEFEKQIKEEHIKPLRYAFASNDALNYGAIIRSFQYLDKDGMPVYKDATLVEHMFGDIVLDEIRQNARRGRLKGKRVNEDGKVEERSLSFEEYVNSREGRTRIVKNVSRAKIAAELKKHRKYGAPVERWNAGMVEKFISALESIHALERDPNNPDKIIENPNKRFYSKEDILWIRKHSGTGRMRMFVRDILIAEGGTGLIKGSYGVVKDFIEDIFK